VVCHGGSGTVFGALAAGVPLVVVPLFADQSENAQRTTAAGAGRTVDADAATIGPDDAPRIAEAIDTVLATPSYRARAERIAAEMATTPSPEAVLDELFSR
jgi:UDP:flavonoid glycosyltransferase YjiC (YdhE family)